MLQLAFFRRHGWRVLRDERSEFSPKDGLSGAVPPCDEHRSSLAGACAGEQQEHCEGQDDGAHGTLHVRLA
jgi:hypothetical protein